MKKLSFLLCMLAVIALSSCSVSVTTKGDNKAAENSNIKRPKYLITVTQGTQNLGTIKMETFPDVAPKHAANFDSLVAIKFYDGTAFHRVIADFMIQGGDPNSKDKPKSTWGKGDPSQTKLPAEFSKLKHLRGIISAARAANNINSATSQFFIVTNDTDYLDGQYSIFGKVLEGWDVVDKIANAPKDANDTPLLKISMKIEKIAE